MPQTKKSYQELKEELDRLLVELQHEGTSIDEAVKLHRQAEATLQELNQYLADLAKAAKLDIKLKKSQ